MPGGASGTRASAISPPTTATATACRSRSSSASRIRKNAGNTTSRPRASGSASSPPPSAPSAVPPIHALSWGSVAPMRNLRSKVPSPRLASAQEASITSCPSAARRNRLPTREGARASPIGRNRALTNTAARVAAPAPPPAPRIEAAANCADPDSTTAEQISARRRPSRAGGPAPRTTRRARRWPPRTAARRGRRRRSPGRRGGRRCPYGESTAPPDTHGRDGCGPLCVATRSG